MKYILKGFLCTFGGVFGLFAALIVLYVCLDFGDENPSEEIIEYLPRLNNIEATGQQCTNNRDCPHGSYCYSGEIGCIRILDMR